MITKKPNLSRKRLKNISLSDQCIDVILGSILGDGSLGIAKNYKNARFTIRHSITQKEYLLWKANKLSEISSPGSLQLQKPDGYSIQEKISFQSKALESLTEICSITHNRGSLVIKRQWLNHLSELSLLIWWLDDGSLVANGKRGVFCTDNFDLKTHKILQQYLEVVWGVSTTIGNLYRNRQEGTKQERNYTKELYHRLYLNTSELKKLFKIIMPFMTSPSMTKKFVLRYKDPQFQQRWISEMKSAMPTLSQTIDEKIENRE